MAYCRQSNKLASEILLRLARPVFEDVGCICPSKMQLMWNRVDFSPMSLTLPLHSTHMGPKLYDCTLLKLAIITSSLTQESIEAFDTQP